MTSLDTRGRRSRPADAAGSRTGVRAARLAPALFAGTLFVSALLLFAVQPMFTKMVLPQARRRAVGVVGRDGVRSRPSCSSATSTPMCWSADACAGRAALVHLGAAGAGRRDAAARHRAGVRRAAGRRRDALAGRPVRGLDRPAVRRAVGQRAAAAELVRRDRPPAGAAIPTCSTPRPTSARSAALLAYPFVIEPLLTLRDAGRARGRSALRCWRCCIARRPAWSRRAAPAAARASPSRRRARRRRRNACRWIALARCRPVSSSR